LAIFAKLELKARRAYGKQVGVSEEVVSKLSIGRAFSPYACCCRIPKYKHQTSFHPHNPMGKVVIGSIIFILNEVAMAGFYQMLI
jgi:hypothetical protein